MISGKMRHFVNIQSYFDNPINGDHTGEVVPEWSTVAQVWASISPSNGSEVVEGGQITEKVTHKMVTRFYEGLTAKNRITEGTTIYEIKNVLNTDERDAEMTLLLEQKL